MAKRRNPFLELLDPTQPREHLREIVQALRSYSGTAPPESESGTISQGSFGTVVTENHLTRVAQLAHEHQMEPGELLYRLLEFALGEVESKRVKLDTLPYRPQAGEPEA